MIQTLYPVFQKWSEKGSVFLIADTHFGAENRELQGYTFSEQEQIDALRNKCFKNDTLIHLGDVGSPEPLAELSCRKILILGNHDVTASKFRPYFDEIYTGPLWVAEKLVLSHEPLCLVNAVTGNQIAFNIHGHDHSGKFSDDYHLNIAQNLFGIYPLELKRFIREGQLKYIRSIHRDTIERKKKC